MMKVVIGEAACRIEDNEGNIHFEGIPDLGAAHEVAEMLIGELGLCIPCPNTSD